LEKANRPIKKTEIIAALAKLVGDGDPTVFLRIKFRTISRYRLTGPFGASYSHYKFRPPGTGTFLRTEGSASEILKQLIHTDNGVSHDIHPRNGEIVDSARIYVRGAMGVKTDFLLHPPKA
jgi:hypothetical protein